MKTPTVALQDAPREFALEEMFFSTTDRKGVITSGNSVFVRVSGYRGDELVGHAHNVIRHPDMPRAAFRLLWRELQAGRAFVALVKNLAKDGRYYWVVAFIVPVADGYLSIRFKPSSPLLAQVEPLYARMRAIEREHDDRGESGRAGMDAAEQVLLETLRGLGFAGYETFMWALMRAEMKSREALLRGREARTRDITGSSAGVARLAAIHAAGECACAQIDRLYSRLDELAAFSDELVKKSTFVTDLTREIRFVALNTALESTRLGEAGNSLAVIARFLGDTSLRTADEVTRLTARIRDITAELQAVSFALSGARLQIEMLLIFCRELTQRDTVVAHGGGRTHADMMAALQRAFAETAEAAMQRLHSLDTHLQELGRETDDLGKTVLMLQVAQVSGLVETSRVQTESSVGAIFGEVRAHVSRTSTELHGLREVAQTFARMVRATPEIERAVQAAAQEMAGLAKNLAPVAAQARQEPGCDESAPRDSRSRDENVAEFCVGRK